MPRNELYNYAYAFRRSPVLIISIIISLLIGSCNNDKKEEPESEPNVPRVNASDLLSSPDSIDVKCFTINKKVIDELYKSTVGRNNRKLIFDVYFDNIKTPANMKVLPYYARRHSQYAEGQKPIVVKDTLLKRIPVSFTIGNSEFRLEQLVKDKDGNDREYDFLIFTPIVKPDKDGIPHLLLHVTGYSAKKAAFDDTFGDCNPTPPGRPGADNPE